MTMYFTGVLLIGVYLIGVRLVGVHLVNMHLIDMHLIGVKLIDMHLMGVYLGGVHLRGVPLISEAYISEAYISQGMYLPEHASHKRASDRYTSQTSSGVQLTLMAAKLRGVNYLRQHIIGFSALKIFQKYSLSSTLT
jgi:uncharacterized protein YjbI with pentapeptide repeats